MYTTKGQGAFLSLLPMSLYVIPYFFWVATNSYAYELTLLFFAGVLFLFLVKIEPGTNGELLWWDQLIIDDQGNAYVWSNGLCLVPTLFPFLHNLGIHPFWWIRRPLSDYLERTSNNVAIEHFVDQRRMNYNVEVKTSFLAANFSRIVENTIG